MEIIFNPQSSSKNILNILSHIHFFLFFQTLCFIFLRASKQTAQRRGCFSWLASMPLLATLATILFSRSATMPHGLKAVGRFATWGVSPSKGYLSGGSFLVHFCGWILPHATKKWPKMTVKLTKGCAQKKLPKFTEENLLFFWIWASQRIEVACAQSFRSICSQHLAHFSSPS